MTIDERVRHAMSGLRLKTDELGRPPSHDEVETMLRKNLMEAREDFLAEAKAAIKEVLPGEVKRAFQDEHFAEYLTGKRKP